MSSPLNNSGSLPPLSRTPADRKNSGINLLDIMEEPLGYVQAKKRKQMQVAVVAPLLRQTSEATSSQAADTPATTVLSYVAHMATVQSRVILPVSQPKQVIKIRPLPPVTQDRLQPHGVANRNNSRKLFLTRAQMLEAHDMFRTANRVTRPEKALILGFMAGARNNPCSDLGNVVTIKLSENQKSVLQADDTYLAMLVETHFQMNYNTGEWKRIKKCRKLGGPNAPLQSVASLAAAATANAT